MNKKFNLLTAALGLAVATALPSIAQAESAQYQCSYTHAVYTAPFMKKPGTRNCPEGRCSYSVQINGDSAKVNGVIGFNVEQTDTSILLTRTAKDPVMGGMDTTKITILKSDMSFEAVKTTTPSVVLTTKGSCS
jgi:hypothetical protein